MREWSYSLSPRFKLGVKIFEATQEQMLNHVKVWLVCALPYWCTVAVCGSVCVFCWIFSHYVTQVIRWVSTCQQDILHIHVQPRMWSLHLFHQSDWLSVTFQALKTHITWLFLCLFVFFSFLFKESKTSSTCECADSEKAAFTVTFRAFWCLCVHLLSGRECNLLDGEL